MKTAVQQTVKPILEKAKQKAGAAAAKAGVSLAQGAEPDDDPREEAKAAPGKKPTVAKGKPSGGPTLKPPGGPTLKAKEDAPSVRTNDRLRGKAAESEEEQQSRPLTTRGTTKPSSMPIP